MARYAEATEREYFFNIAIAEAGRSYEELQRRYANHRSVSIHSYLGFAARLRAIASSARS
jgi:hypothetical protein